MRTRPWFRLQSIAYMREPAPKTGELIESNVCQPRMILPWSNTRTNKFTLWILAILLALFSLSCERKTVVQVTGGNPPTFLISGSGDLGEVIISKPAEEQTKNPLDEQNVIWKVTASKREPVEVVRSVTYGITPPGFKQSVPQNGSPPTLDTNKRYGYWFVTADAPQGAGYFEIRNGKAFAFEEPRSNIRP